MKNHSSKNLVITAEKKLHVGDSTYDVQIGSNGFVAASDKKEGDCKTPCGKYPIRVIYYREDRIKLPEVKVAAHVINKNDGWCDDPNDEFYNRFVKLPYKASHENLWRSDPLYDVMLTIGYNDDPPVPGKGSAIFIHIAREKFTPTAGCIALKSEDLMSIIGDLGENSYIDIIGDSL